MFSAVALPLTYFPIPVTANDPDHVGENVNGRVTNLLSTAYLVLIVVAAVTAHGRRTPIAEDKEKRRSHGPGDRVQPDD